MHAPLAPALLAAVDELVASGRFINGPAVAEFEGEWAEYCGTEHCVGVASGLDALRLGLIAAGLTQGDEVIVPASTFAATFEAVTQAGGTPVPVDITFSDYGLDISEVRDAMTPRTRFVMPVHLYGQCSDLQALQALTEGKGCAIVEDACQAHGARRDNLGAGTVGRFSAFSFYPAKNLGAMGDAGALVTNDAELAQSVVALREHGQREKYRHHVEGFTARLDTIQALVLLHKLPQLDEWTAQRREIASAYDEALNGVGDLQLPAVPPGSEPVWHLYVVRTGKPEQLADFLQERSIGTGRHYPEPPPLSEAYERLGYQRGDFPRTEELSAEALSLPIFPGMTEAQLDAVVAGVRDYFDG